ncbi:MAG: GNAT family N-acetyltransferase [Bacteroidota bacterium]
MECRKLKYEEILPLREQFLTEHPFQIRYDACHWRAWADEYLFIHNGQGIGYGSIKGLKELVDRDTVFEFFVLPAFRKQASHLFAQLLRASGASHLECQSNDFWMSSMMYEFGEGIHSRVILFGEHRTTDMTRTDVIFRSCQSGDDVFGKKDADRGAFVLERQGEIVADGGFLTHYNPPFADLYMEVKEACRREGLGSFMLQEVKKACHEAGHIPAARCNITNLGSRFSLLKAGMKICGYMLQGKVKPAHAAFLD